MAGVERLRTAAHHPSFSLQTHRVSLPHGCCGISPFRLPHPLRCLEDELRRPPSCVLPQPARNRQVSLPPRSRTTGAKPVSCALQCCGSSAVFRCRSPEGMPFARPLGHPSAPVHPSKDIGHYAVRPLPPVRLL